MRFIIKETSKMQIRLRHFHSQRNVFGCTIWGFD